MCAVKAAVPRRFRAHLANLPAGVDVAWYTNQTDYREAIRGSGVLWLNVQTASAVVEMLNQAGDMLQWVFTHWVGVDRLPLQLFKERGITLTNAAGVNSIAVSEYVVMAMLAAAKGLPAMIHAQARGEWLARPPAFAEVHGSAALILGLGHTGRNVAARLRPFGVRITGVRRRSTEERDVIGVGDWRPRLAEFDWIVVTAPLTAGTNRLLGEAEFSAMKPTAWVMNVARAPMIDTEALETALKTGGIGGAYLDVTEPEPLHHNSPLWHLPNVIITPHAAWASAQFDRRVATMFVKNLIRHVHHRPLVNVVDLDAGY